MAVDVVDPFDDPRVKHLWATVNGLTYKYLYAVPTSGDYRATVFLIHGWPDLSAGWRYQIPALLALGCRVVCPDLMGFGGTAMPKVPPEDLALYSQKRASDDIKELARQLKAPSIILGGHDWGGAVVYRCALWHPDLVTHVFSVCTPYTPPSRSYVSLDMVVERASQFGYQKQLAGPDVEARIQTKDDIRNFLNGMYGARTPNGEVLFSPTTGIDFERLPKMGKSPLLTDREADYYVRAYARNGLHGTLNWYRTRKANWEEERELKSGKLYMPILFITAKKDNVLLPSLSKGMEEYIPNLSRGEVNAGHWALWQTPAEVNDILTNWFENVVFGMRSKI